MLRSFILIVWTGLIFLFTCTVSMEQFIHHGMISFQWSTQPNFDEFLYPLPPTPDAYFISRKLGHAISFFILTILLFTRFFSKISALIFSISYAILTEVLQLFFHRGGRLFDIGFDGVGIVVGLLVIVGFENSFNVEQKSLMKKV